MSQADCRRPVDTGRSQLLYRVDLHVHTPRSACYRDASVNSRQIVAAALDAGLDVIAITDHRSFAGAVELCEAARGTRLTAFPHIEVTGKEGHFLGIQFPGSAGG